MDSNERLNVWHNESHVGQLWQDSNTLIGFQYEDEWVKNGFAISHQLPLTLEPFTPIEKKAHIFFANLLPEAGAREHIVRDLKLANNDFELLKAIGSECAGTLSILPDNITPSQVTSYKRLNEDELYTILLRKGSITHCIAKTKLPRLSLAGAQDKLPIYVDGENYYLPEDSSPSTHILKFEISGYKHIPAYEYFLAQLAKYINLPTVECDLKKHRDIYFLQVTRYDRLPKEGDIIQRCHQEDFCQALGYSYDKKYQNSGGPSFFDCYNLIQTVSADPLVDGENLLKWQVFNLLTGNSDGHAKNLSLIYQKNNQFRLAPFYDLVCTRAIERIDPNLALSIGNQYDPGHVTHSDWLDLSKSCEIHPKQLEKYLIEVAEGLKDCLDSCIENFEAQHGEYPALQRVKKIVLKQRSKLLNSLK